MAKLAVILLTCLSVSLAYANDSEEIAAWHEAILANIYDYYPEAECYAYSENGNDYCMAVDLADTLSYEGGYDLYIATKGTNVVARDDESMSMIVTPVAVQMGCLFTDTTNKTIVPRHYLRRMARWAILARGCLTLS